MWFIEQFLWLAGKKISESAMSMATTKRHDGVIINPLDRRMMANILAAKDPVEHSPHWIRRDPHGHRRCESYRALGANLFGVALLLLIPVTQSAAVHDVLY